MAVGTSWPSKRRQQGREVRRSWQTFLAPDHEALVILLLLLLLAQSQLPLLLLLAQSQLLLVQLVLMFLMMLRLFVLLTGLLAALM